MYMLICWAAWFKNLYEKLVWRQNAMRSHESFNVVLHGISHSHSSVQPKIFRSHFFLAPPKILRICSIVLLTLYRYHILFSMENIKATNQDMSFSETQTTHTLFGIVIFQHPKFAIRFAITKTSNQYIAIYRYFLSPLLF